MLQADEKSIGISLVAGGSDAVRIDDDVFTGEQLELAAGDTRSLFARADDEQKPGHDEGKPGGLVWRPEPLQYVADAVLALSASEIADTDLKLFAREVLAENEAARVEISGSSRLRLSELRQLIEPAEQAASGRLIIDVRSRDG